MNPQDIPVQSIKSLVNASLVALFLALVILFTAVLPAEYGIDPTGLGGKMGLVALSELGHKNVTENAGNCVQPEQGQRASVVEKQPGATVASSTSGVDELAASKPGQWRDTVKITVPPKKGLEYKFALDKDALLDYAWQTDGAALYFDFHGEPKGEKNGYFKSYQESASNQSSGSLTAPFAGVHGWYWENDSDQPIVVTLSTNGAYQIVGIIK
jgi:hypothetical protein